MASFGNQRHGGTKESKCDGGCHCGGPALPVRTKYRPAGEPSGVLEEAKDHSTPIYMTSLLYTPASSVLCEQVFSKAGEVVSRTQNRLKTKKQLKDCYRYKNDWNPPCPVHHCPSYTSIFNALFLVPQVLSLSSACWSPCCLIHDLPYHVVLPFLDAWHTQDTIIS